MHPLILLLCIYSVSATISTWQKLYNCNLMVATIFPIQKSILTYGPKRHQMWGKWWKDTQAEYPSCQEKVLQSLFTAKLAIPKDKAAATKAYNELRDQLYARQEVPQTKVAPTEFEEKIKLNVFASILGWKVVGESFPSLQYQDPSFWLNSDFKLFINWEELLLRHYQRASLLRSTKRDYFDRDYCSELAKSLEESPREWASGKAKDAFKLVFRCFDTFPHSPEASNELLSGALMLIDLFVFSNISVPTVGATKFIRFLKEQQVVFDSNFRWHDFVPKVLNIFKDAHVSFKSDCYESFTYIQPVFLQKILRDHNEQFIITKTNSDELRDWVNAEVVGINGGIAEVTIDDYATMTGKCHDSRARSAFVLSRKQWAGQDFSLERGFYLKRSTLPTRQFLVYILKKPGSDFLYEVKVDWMVFKGDTLKGFDDQYTYWKNNCAAKPFERKQALFPSPVLTKRAIINHKISPPHRSTILKRDTTYQPTTEGVTPIAVGPGFSFFILTDDLLGAYGVLVIQTFEVGDVEGWFKGMRDGFQKLIQAGVKNLLLDLSGNTGGVLCLAYSLLGVLSPSPIYPFPATKYAYGTRANPSELLTTFSKCADEANIKGSPFKLQTFKNLTCNCDFAPNVDWDADVNTEINLVNGLFQSYSKYSTFLLDRCDLKFSPLLSDVKPDFKNVIVLSDGLCGSSCAIVSLYLQQNGSPGIAIATGFSPLIIAQKKLSNIYSMGLFAFAGGQVVSIDNIKDVAKRSSCFDMVPKPLERLRITFTFRAIFNLQDKNNPLEYYIIPANATLPYNDEFTNSISARWKSAFPLGMDVLENPGKYPKYEKTLITSSTRFSYLDMNDY